MTKLQIAEKNARAVLESFPSEREYHNLEHVESVVRVAEELAQEKELSDEDIELLLVAAWYHDLGYANGPAEGHEERSCEFVTEHLGSLFSKKNLSRITTTIMATEWPQSPRSEMGRILADADVHSLGTDASDETRKRVFEELKQIEYPNLSWDEYLHYRIEMFEEYEFHTPEGRERFQERLDKNIQRLREQIDE